jgi:phi LC3 family holin
MDLKKRAKNKAFWVSLIAAIVPFIYQILGLFGVVAPISSSEVIKATGLVLNILVAAGVLIDPTTPGVKDKEAK